MDTIKLTEAARIATEYIAAPADQLYLKATRDSVTVYVREVLQREPGPMQIELLPAHQARATFTIDGLPLFCTASLGTGHCLLEIDTSCETCGATQRRAFASLAALGRILESTRCTQCAAAERGAPAGGVCNAAECDDAIASGLNAAAEAIESSGGH